MNLFQRQCSLVLEGTEYTGLRVVFTVTKTLEKEPNTADITIYNLSEDSRGKLAKKYIPTILSAGYTGGQQTNLEQLGIIFSGDARHIDHMREGANWVTHVRAGDGEKAFQYAQANLSFKANTPHTTVLRELASATTLNKGNLEDMLASLLFTNPTATFRKGYSAQGPAFDHIQKLARSHNFTTSIQQGALKFTPVVRNSTAFLETAVLLDATSGLVDSPALGSSNKQDNKPPVLKVRSLLRPEFQCGSLVEIDAVSVQGTFLIERLVHTGDTDGGQWYTDLEVTRLE